MALLVTGLWQLATAVIIFFNISAALPSVERPQRQIELKLMHDAAMRREYEKTIKLLEEMLNEKSRPQRQIELKLMHDAAMRREYEKTIKLLEEMLNEKSRPQRQIELKLIHDAAMRREHEKTIKLLEELLKQKRSVPNTAGAKDASDFIDNNNKDSWSSEEKLIKLKTCLQFLQNLDTRFPGSNAKDTTSVISRSICQRIVELNEAASGAPADENQE